MNKTFKTITTIFSDSMAIVRKSQYDDIAENKTDRRIRRMEYVKRNIETKSQKSRKRYEARQIDAQSQMNA